MAESTASTNKVDSTSDIADAVTHLNQGKRYLLLQDHVAAVSSLQEACQLFAEKYGEAANECGEPYLYYGKALLELARMETGVLGNALEGVPAEEDESDSEDDGQVESPDNVTEEEREKIKYDVDAAIDENSRDLDEKFQQLKEKSENEAATSMANDTKLIDISDKLGDMVEEEISQVKDKTVDETVSATANENKKSEVSGKLDGTINAEGSSTNAKLKPEKADGTSSKKDEMDDQNTTKNTAEMKEVVEKVLESVTDGKKVEVTDGGDKYEDPEKVEETEMTTDSGRKSQNEIEVIEVTKISEKKVQDDKMESETDEKAVEGKDVEETVEKIKDAIKDAKETVEMIKNATDGVVELIKDAKDVLAKVIQDSKEEDIADKSGKTEKEIANATEKADLETKSGKMEKEMANANKKGKSENDVEVKGEVSMETELAEKSEASLKEEVLQASVKEDAVIDGTNVDEKMEASEKVEEVVKYLDKDVSATVATKEDKMASLENVEDIPKDSVKEVSAKNEDEEMETEEIVKSNSITVEKKLKGGDVNATEKDENKIEEATCGTSNGVTEPSSAQDESMEDDDVDAVEENDASIADAANDESEAGPSGSNEEKEEEITNLQLGWEVLEIAKLIFKRQSETDKKMELKTAEVLLKLGEVSIESENYKQAIEDLGECLRLQKLHLTPDDRAIAETFYQLGLANSFYGQFEDAIESFRKSMQVIEERIATLQQAMSGSVHKNADAGSEDPVDAAKREIEDLQGVLPDIESKIEDTEDLRKNSEVAFKEAALQRLQENVSTASVETSTCIKEQDSSKPTNNITHLLKRKRKSDSSADTNKDIDVKKHRAASGDHCANGTAVSNGNASPIMKDDSFQKVESTA